jgi:hypothetical protein
MKRKKEYILIPLIDMNKMKLDARELKKVLIYCNGRGTDAWKNFDFSSISGDFEEKDESQKYTLMYEITKRFETIKQLRDDYCFVVGQSGLFLKTDKSKSYEKVSEEISEAKSFTEFCKPFLFKPYAIEHWSDGDYYISKEEYLRTPKWMVDMEIIESEVE